MHFHVAAVKQSHVLDWVGVQVKLGHEEAGRLAEGGAALEVALLFDVVLQVLRILKVAVVVRHAILDEVSGGQLRSSERLSKQFFVLGVDPGEAHFAVVFVSEVGELEHRALRVDVVFVNEHNDPRYLILGDA